MAPKKSFEQHTLDAKEAIQHRRKKIVFPRKMEDTSQKTVVDELVLPTKTDSPQTRSTKRTSTRPSAKRTRSSSTPSKKKLRIDQSGSRSASSSKGKAQVLDSDFNIPLSWFNNQENYGKWVDWFHAKPVGLCDMIDPQLLDEMPLLKVSGCDKMLNPGMDSYPRLTRLFYLNLKGVHQDDGICLESLVAGVKISLTHKILRQILDIDPDDLTQSQPPRADCIAAAKSQFLLPNYSNVRQLTQSFLKLEPKVIFLILVRCIVPRETSKELLTDKLLHLIYLVLSGYKVDIPNVLAAHMLRAVSSTRNTHLPYSNFLPLIFRAFDVPLENEEKLSTGPAYIDANTLQKLEIVKTSEGVWKFIRDLTDAEKSCIPNLKFKGSQSAPSSSQPFDEELAEVIKTMQLDILETRELMVDVAENNNFLVGQVNLLIEKTEYLEDIIRKGQYARTNQDIPESSKQKEPSSPTADTNNNNTDQDDMDTAQKTSPLTSLARLATSIIEDIVATIHTPEVADPDTNDVADPDTTKVDPEQGIEEPESAQAPQEPQQVDPTDTSTDDAALVDALDVAADPSSSSTSSSSE